MEKQYWFNTKTKMVEEGPQSLSIERLGPFKTKQEALLAPQIVAERARRLREEDRKRDEWD